MKKLHRVPESRKIAGVCAGLGEYFELDPVLFRLVFVISMFFGGVGLLVYVLLWILVPEGPGPEGQARPLRRLHLSRTDRKIAGVCGGLGEWLEIDPVFVRVAFVLLALACGLGLVVYILLWVLAPRAPSAPAAPAAS
jgi:phage shock protein PspC (stress-responsive transcriptional regulator)